MAHVTLCDRCGKSTKDDYERSFISRYRCRWVKIDIDPMLLDRETYCLCGDCSKLLNSFLNEKREG